MSNAQTFKGEILMEKGVASAPYTTTERLAFTPENDCTTVYDTDLKREFTWIDSAWVDSIPRELSKTNASDVIVYTMQLPDAAPTAIGQLLEVESITGAIIKMKWVTPA